MSRRLALLAVACLSLAACAVGPAEAHDRPWGYGYGPDARLQADRQRVWQERRDLEQAYYWREEALRRGDWHSARRAERRIAEEQQDLWAARRQLHRDREWLGRDGYRGW